MFSKVRTSLKAGSKGRRQTLRSQRGGAAFVIIPSVTSDSTDKDNPAAVAARSVFWKRYLPITYKDGVINAKNYISLIEDQTQLFELAMDAVYETAGITDRTNEAQILEKYNDILEENIQKCYNYLFDIAMAIYLMLDPAKKKTIKLEKLEKAEKFLELLLNPNQAINIFLRFLAETIILQRSKTETLEILNSSNKVKKDIIITARAVRYNAEAHTNAYSITSDNMRDGFFLMQSVANIKSDIAEPKNVLTGFWGKFVKECINELDMNHLKQLLHDIDPTGDKVDVRHHPFAMMAALIFKKYDGTNSGTLKNIIFNELTDKHHTTGTPPVIATERTVTDYEKGIMPDDITSITVSEGKTLDVVLKFMRIEHVHFILHLIAEIKNVENINASKKYLTDLGDEKLLKLVNAKIIDESGQATGNRVDQATIDGLGLAAAEIEKLKDFKLIRMTVLAVTAP